MSETSREEVRARAVERCQERGVLIPTLAAMRDPETIDPAVVDALTGVDMLTDPGLLEEAKAFFLEKTGGEPYRSPIPVDQKPPIP